MFYLGLLFFLFQQWRSEKTIASYLTNIDVDYMTVLCYDNCKTYRTFDIKMDIGFSYVNKNFPDQKGRTHVGDTTIDVYKFHNISARIYLEEIGFKLSKEILKSFYYFQCDKITSENTISLAHKFIDKRYSIVHQLFIHRLIDNKKFSFYIDSFFGGQLIFGDIPQNITILYPYKVSIPIEKDDIKWKSKLSTVTYKNIKYDNSEELYFDSSVSSILVPFSFLNEYNDIVLKEYIYDNICKMDTMGEQVRYKCQCRGLDNFPSIDFIFDDNIKIHLTREELFLNYTDVCYFRIENNAQNRHKWVFGLPVLKKYIVEFDYTNDSVSLYSKSPFDSINDNTISKIIYISISLTLLMGIAYDRIINKNK